MSASNRGVCRIINQNSCGSGMIVGHWKGGSLVLTNAHVAGSKIGRVVSVEIESLNNRKLSGKVIRAAYSNSVSADWAIIHIEGFQEVKPVYLSKNLPEQGEQLWTKGFPACRAFAGQKVTQHATLNNGVLLWLPDARSGQSGSSVVDIDDQVVVALLTWSMTRNGRSYGAGQLTAEIYKQNRDSEIRGYAKMPGLVELSPNPDIGNIDDFELKEGFYSIPIERGVQDLPIWAEDVPQNPDDPPIASDKQAIASLRRVRDAVDAEIKRFENSTSQPIDPGDKDALEDTFGL